MFNLFEIMRQAQGGAAVENMARQFGLTPDQARQATQALLPAFTLGLQRNAADPQSFAQLLGMMTSGRYAGFFEQPASAFTPQAMTQGQDVLGRLFGSPEMTRQIAQQAAVASGVGTQVLLQMLPVMAATLMGGLVHAAGAQGLNPLFAWVAELFKAGAPPQPSPPSSLSWPEAFGAMFGQMAQAGASPAGRSAPPPSNQPLENPFEAFFKGMAEASRPPTPEAAPKAPPGPAPGSFEAMIGDMLKAMQPPAAQPEPPKPEPDDPKPNGTPDPLALWGRMFQTGQDVQAQHLASLQTLFDEAWSQGRKEP